MALAGVGTAKATVVTYTDPVSFDGATSGLTAETYTGGMNGQWIPNGGTFNGITYNFSTGTSPFGPLTGGVISSQFNSFSGVGLGGGRYEISAFASLRARAPTSRYADKAAGAAASEKGRAFNIVVDRLVKWYCNQPAVPGSGLRDLERLILHDKRGITEHDRGVGAMLTLWFPFIATTAENVRFAGNTEPDTATEQRSTLLEAPGLAITPSILTRTYTVKPKAEQDAL